MIKNKISNTICLVDFGLSDYYNKNGYYLYKKCGTPGYAAPEVLREDEYDMKIDIFSLGAIMY